MSSRSSLSTSVLLKHRATDHGHNSKKKLITYILYDITYIKRESVVQVQSNVLHFHC